MQIISETQDEHDRPVLIVRAHSEYDASKPIRGLNYVGCNAEIINLGGGLWKLRYRPLADYWVDHPPYVTTEMRVRRVVAIAFIILWVFACLRLAFLLFVRWNETTL